MIPRATYRLQLHRDFGFDAATELVDYLADLGISHIYLSPYLKARPGSAHGYDIVDHSRINPELGGEEALARLNDALRRRDLGQILDFVPNHMGVGGADNPLWLDVLEWGEDSEHAGWFDIDWDPDRRYLRGKILVPFLGDQYGVELERGVLRLKLDESTGSFAVWAYDTHKLPIWPPHYARILGDGHPHLERLADAFAWLATSQHKMPRRAQELKTQLATLLRERPDAREALHVALNRFDGRSGETATWRTLDRLIRDQHWRVANFRVAADDINYRRFFNINDLAGLRMELPEVFDHAHQRVLQLVRDGVVDGLRIDHIDGLFDPKGYLQRLQHRVAARYSGEHFYLAVEKILSRHEKLRDDWPVDGTTGYDFLNQVLTLLIDPASETTLTDCYAEFCGERRSFAQIEHISKLHIMENEMASELNVLARDLGRLARQNPRSADFTRNLLRRAVKELVACFPVYRTYVDGGDELNAADQRDLAWALSHARRNESHIDPSVFDFLERVLSGELAQRARTGFSRQAVLRCAQRLQQYSGPVVAKGLEDTAFYRYHRFIALNEVGGDPERFGTTLASFHRINQVRAQRWPHSMLTTATHDTKRGEDTRARLAALSEFADEWARSLSTWSRILRGPAGTAEYAIEPDRNDEYLLYQQLAGTWPCELLGLDEPSGEALEAYCARVRAAMIKSLREARIHTGWDFPNSTYEQAMSTFIDAALTGNRAGVFLASFVPFVRRLAAAGLHNSLIQTTLKLTAPGLPDIYAGGELWDLSMVDPDNRRPVDYAARARMLSEVQRALRTERTACMRQWLTDWHDGRIKLALTTTLLQHRRAAAPLYRYGEYEPLQAEGTQAEQICAFLRRHEDDRLLVAVARFPGRRIDRDFEATHLSLPAWVADGAWVDLLTGRRLTPRESQLDASALFELLPVAVLRPAESGTADDGR